MTENAESIWGKENCVLGKNRDLGKRGGLRAGSLGEWRCLGVFISLNGN